MLEISLFLILTILTLIDAYKSRVISLLLKLVPLDAEIKSRTEDINVMSKELNTISLVNEFAKHVKLQRKILKLTSERKELRKKHAFKVMKIRFSMLVAFYIIIFGSLITMVWFYRSEPVAKLPPHWLWPFSTYFDWSNNIPGYVTVPCWIAISSRATKIIAQHF